MIKLDVLDTKGKVLEQISLDKELFGIKPNKSLVAQYLRVYLANQRQGTSSTKTRGEVSGGGIKPWRQKGTGRARVGSSRNAIWVHGGISHGPKPKSWSLSMPKKMKQAALLSVLSSKISNNQIKVLSKFHDDQKTKNVSNLLDSVEAQGRTLLVVSAKNDTLRRSAENVKNVDTTIFNLLNAYDLLKAKTVLFEKDAILKLEEKIKSTK